MKEIIPGTVVTSRVRLARNLSGYNFKSTMQNKAVGREIINRTVQHLNRYGIFDLYVMGEISLAEREELKERYVISEALKNNTETGAVVTNKDGNLSVMINEEDHIREQMLVKGNNLRYAYNQISALDNWLSRNLGFAKSPSLGYLTACPTNLGTGLRASAMMFLPALTKRNLIGTLYEKAKTRGLTVRGVFGEGSSGDSCLYQVSNEVTLGMNENDIIKRVEDYVLEVANIESTNAFSEYNKNKNMVEDSAYRALGILTNCRLLSYTEFSALIANLKSGAMLGFIGISEITALDDLLVTARPYTLRNALLKSGNQINENNLNAFRAEYVRECLAKIIK